MFLSYILAAITLQILLKNILLEEKIPNTVANWRVAKKQIVEKGVRLVDVIST